MVAQASRALLESIRAEARTRHLVGRVAASAGVGGVPGGAGVALREYDRVPDVRAVEEMLGLARRLVFPGFFDQSPLTDAELPGWVDHLTARVAAHVQQQVQVALRYVCGVSADPAWSAGRSGSDERAAVAADGSANFWGPWRARMARAGVPVPESGSPCDAAAKTVTRRFLERLPELRRIVALDVLAAFDGDPAAEHTDEIILCYPGVQAMLHHRLAHELYGLGVPLLPRIISETAHRLTGIDIHPGAVIGDSFFVDHGAGTVIGETAVIGRQCKVYQGVTLGAKSFPKDDRGRLIRGAKRHPTLEDRVTVYAGAVILGGDTVIGHDCVISGGVFVTNSVQPRHVVGQKKPELRVLGNPNAPEFGMDI